jgi:competence protein ComEC
MLHPARIFTFYLIVFIFMVCFLTIFPTHAILSSLWLLVVAFSLLALWRFRVIRYSLLLVVIFFVISFRVSSLSPATDPGLWWSSQIGEKVESSFVIVSEPKVVGKNQVVLIRSLDSSMKGNIELSTNQFPERRFGEIAQVSGKLQSIDSQKGLNKSQQIVARMSYPKVTILPGVEYPNMGQRIYFEARSFLIGIKNQYVLKTGQILPEPEAGLLSGIIFGTKAELSTYLLSILVITGTVHIIALSGYNITIVANGSEYLTKKLNRNMSFLIPVMGITLFIMATGLSASVIRAGIMGVMLLLAARLGRQSDSLNAVLLASCIMALVNPYIVLYDVGFQLSFSAVAGIIFLQPALEKYFIPLGKTIGPIMAGTIAAQLFSWPIIAYYFGRVSIISIIANALILPLIPFVMLLGFLVITLGFVSLALSKIFGVLVWGLLYYVLKVCDILAGVKFASISYNVGIIFLVAYYILLLELTFWLNQRRKKDLIEKI